ncbi:YkgJ family cysteine cluster protein [Chloroflexota bacterium]
MKKASRKSTKYISSSQRLEYPDDEARYPWLSTLLDTYHVIDSGISIELKQEELKRKAKVACHRGCSNCCLNPTIPVTGPEIWGISWFASEKLEGSVREVVSKQILHQTETTQCPFLVNKLCSIYPVRPTACRIIFMFGVPCKPYEDIAETRMSDILHHNSDLGMRAAMTLLPLFGIKGKRDKEKAFKEGYMRSVAVRMHKISWMPLYHQMKKFDE